MKLSSLGPMTPPRTPTSTATATRPAIEAPSSRGGPDEVGTLFQRFQHTGAAQTREGGSGFGLYMSSKLAVANSGTITYEPGPPHRFVLRTPTSAAAADRALS
jgi:hypothetical protein